MVKRVIDLEARRRIVEILEHTLSYRDAKLIVAIPMITVTRHNYLHLGVNKKALKQGKGKNKATERASSLTSSCRVPFISLQI